MVLPAPARAENDAEFPLLDGKIYVIQRFDDRVARLVMLADVFKSDIAHGKASFSMCKNKYAISFLSCLKENADARRTKNRRRKNKIMDSFLL